MIAVRCYNLVMPRLYNIKVAVFAVAVFINKSAKSLRARVGYFYPFEVVRAVVQIKLVGKMHAQLEHITHIAAGNANFFAQKNRAKIYKSIFYEESQ